MPQVLCRPARLCHVAGTVQAVPRRGPARLGSREPPAAVPIFLSSVSVLSISQRCSVEFFHAQHCFWWMIVHLSAKDTS
jgi:hypothetical protein